ncbi:MAG TPA: hypothetical protein EYO33_03335 [Phycisphaerales bacterium]|nr:hypothetical protein [Phycisphaerales bacterium]
MMIRTLMILLLGFLTLQAWARPLDADTLLTRHCEATSQLEDVKSKANLNLNVLLGVLPYSEKLNGRYFYQKPNRHKLEFDNAPAYLEKAPSLFKWDLPSTEKYKTKILQHTDENSHHLLFLPKNGQSSTLSIKCIFDAENYRLLSQETTYRDGGTVNLSFIYKDGTKLPVLEKVEAKVTIPSYSLTGGATITFSGQEVNQGLDESVFHKTDA